MYLVFRYKLPIIFIVVNNNGIGFGMDKDSFNSARTDTDPMLRSASAQTVVVIFSVCVDL